MTVTVFPTDHTTLIVEAHIPNRTPAEVYDHWADSAKLATWWVPDVRQNDVTRGGAFEYHWPDGGWTHVLARLIAICAGPEARVS
jgi:uncharacterized protein YndB with AHSA1/START domain